MNAKRRSKKPTTTTLALSWLAQSGDFATGPTVAAAVQRTNNQTSAALRWLRKRKAVDCLAEDGQLWWFSTIENDDRLRIINEITDEPIVKLGRRKPAAPKKEQS